MPEQYLRTEDVAEQFGFPVNTLRHWRAQNDGPPYARVGRRVFYRASDVRAWIDSKFQKAAG